MNGSKTSLISCLILATVLLLGGACRPQPTQTTTAPTVTPVVTEIGVTPAATETIPTPDRLVIDPGNANYLKPSEQFDFSGANNFFWVSGNQSLVMTTNEGVLLYGLNPPVPIAQVSAANPAMLTVSPGQDAVAWASEDNTIHLWSVAEGRELLALDGGAAAVTSLSLSPQGNDLAAAAYDNTLKLWDVSSGQLVKTWELPVWLSNLSYSPDGASLAGVDLPNFTVYVFDLATGETQKTLQWTDTASPALYGAYFSPDWRALAWVARGTVQLMGVASGELGPTLDHEDFVTTVAWSPDGRLLATAAAATVDGDFVPVVLVWDISTGQVVNTITQPSPVLRLSFSSDGRELAILHSDGTLRSWSVVP